MLTPEEVRAINDARKVLRQAGTTVRAATIGEQDGSRLWALGILTAKAETAERDLFEVLNVDASYLGGAAAAADLHLNAA